MPYDEVSLTPHIYLLKLQQVGSCQFKATAIESDMLGRDARHRSNLRVVDMLNASESAL